MNTKVVMTTSAIIFGGCGILLTFAPDIISGLFFSQPDKMTQLLFQVIGGLYFAFGMLNWMTKESMIGGIYNRPIAVANFTHFFVAGLAILKSINLSNPISAAQWLVGMVYLVYGLIFGLILFRHPLKKSKAEADG